jgi:hypothetical protein
MGINHEHNAPKDNFISRKEERKILIEHDTETAKNI